MGKREKSAELGSSRAKKSKVVCYSRMFLLEEKANNFAERTTDVSK